MALKFDDYFEENEEERQRDADMIELDKKREAKQKKEEEAKARADEDIEDTFIIPNSHRRKKLWMRWSVVVVLLLIAYIVVNNMYFTPLVKEGQIRGYIVKMEKVGQFFDSYEGELVMDNRQVSGDTTSNVFNFSLTDEVLGEKLMGSMAKDSAVVMTYRRYGNALPWRGNSEVEVYDAHLVKLLSKKRK